MIAESPLPIEGEVLTRRIFAPTAYSRVRDMSEVPIVYSEAEKLAAWFPLAWRREADGGARLVILRSLVARQAAQPPRARGLLPLLLTAYPFVLDPTVDAGEAEIRFDDVFADEPSDAGSCVMLADLKPGLATLQRMEALGRFSLDWPRTQAMGRALAERRLLEPWDLRFEIEGRPVTVDGLWIADRAAFETGRYAPILAEFGADAARLIGLHRLSLYRAGILLTMARQALRPLEAEPAAEFAL